MIYDHVPEAVQKVLSNNDIWWEHGQRSTMQQFLSQYTLHDSTLLGIQIKLLGSAFALIRLDFIDPAAKKLDLWTEGDYLCISFPNVHQSLSDHAEKYTVDNIINHASTKLIDAQQRELWLELFLKLDMVKEDAGHFLLDENLHCTTFEGTVRNHLHILHSEPTLFLCVKFDGTIVKLPDLDLMDKSASLDNDETMPSI